MQEVLIGAASALAFAFVVGGVMVWARDREQERRLGDDQADVVGRHQSYVRKLDPLLGKGSGHRKPPARL